MVPFHPTVKSPVELAKNNQEQFVDIELFAGGGGLALGLKMAGFFPARLYEVDTPSCETLRYNVTSKNPTLIGQVFEGKTEDVDWRSLEGKVRLLAGGAPCQPFSLAGKHRAEHDGRNLFPEVLRAARELKPAAVLLENVRGLARDSFRPYFEYILRQLECPSIKPRPNELWQSHDKRIRRYQLTVGYEPEYRVNYRLVDAADYGVPQNRYRVFIIATRCDFAIYDFPQRTHSRAALQKAQQTKEYWERRGVRKPKHSFGNGNGAKKLPLDGKLPWVTVRDALKGLPEPSNNQQESLMNHWIIPGARAYPGHSGSILDWPAKTIKAGVHGVPGGENTLVNDAGHFRYFTLREAARLQTFPDSHFFEGARIHVTRQIGNAVPPLLAAVLARPLYDIIQSGVKRNRRSHAA